MRQIVKDIRAEGSNYISVPPYPGKWPFYTAGRDAMAGQVAAAERKADHSDCGGGT